MSEELMKRLDLTPTLNAEGGDIFQIAERKLDKMMELCKTLVETGFMPSAVKSPAQALAIILTGREMGIPMMQALRQVQVIQGRTTIASELMLAQVYTKIPGFQHEIVERSAKKATVKFSRPGAAPYVHSFTIEDAQAMQLADKDNYKKQPATMLLWRCISGGLRVYVPFAVNGMYLPEEIDPDNVTVTPDGEMIVNPQATTAKPKATTKKTATEKPPIEVKPEPEPEAKPETTAAPEPQEPVKETKAEEEPPLTEETRKRVLGAFKAYGITEDDLEAMIDKVSADWTESDRVYLLGQYKTIKNASDEDRDDTIKSVKASRR